MGGHGGSLNTPCPLSSLEPNSTSHSNNQTLIFVNLYNRRHQLGRSSENSRFWAVSSEAPAPLKPTAYPPQSPSSPTALSPARDALVTFLMLPAHNSLSQYTGASDTVALNGTVSELSIDFSCASTTGILMHMYHPLSRGNCVATGGEVKLFGTHLEMHSKGGSTTNAGPLAALPSWVEG